ncbi:MAG: SMP-30/gluconolactonase/LRE family protein [Desulfobacterales bacterium]|nr:MAG: SMP-30/gluconolactonase/LRE family protein [Desulfobacterales bacterium]
MAQKTEILLDGLMFPEGPRWHEEKLWFSDMIGGQVMAVDMNGKAEVIVEVPQQPSGLGWLPDGKMLIVSMLDRRLLRLDAEGLVEVADLSGLASFHCNDMVVDHYGRAYIGNFGFDLNGQKPFAPAEIILVTPEGKARVVADEMAFPNGSVITPDGGTLIVAETFGSRLTAFDIEADGSLSHRRTWAKIEDAYPDGICLDAEGAIWVASPAGIVGVMRVCEGGQITHHINVSTQAYACMLGGPQRNTLFLLTAETINPQGARAKSSGRLEVVQVDIPGAGLP